MSRQRLTQLTRLEAAKATRNDDLDGNLLVFDYGDGHKRRWRGYDHSMVIEALRPAEEATND